MCRTARDAGGDAAGVDEALYIDAAAWRTADGLSERERLAAEMAERFCEGHLDLAADDAFFARLRAAYSDAEVVELGLSLALWLGQGRLMKVLDVGQTCRLVLNEPRA